MYIYNIYIFDLSIIGSWCGSAGSDPPPLTGFALQNPQPMGVHPVDGHMVQFQGMKHCKMPTKQGQTPLLSTALNRSKAHPSVGDSVSQNQWEEGGLTQQTRISSLWQKREDYWVYHGLLHACTWLLLVSWWGIISPTVTQPLSRKPFWGINGPLRISLLNSTWRKAPSGPHFAF